MTFPVTYGASPCDLDLKPAKRSKPGTKRWRPRQATNCGSSSLTMENLFPQMSATGAMQKALTTSSPPPIHRHIMEEQSASIELFLERHARCASHAMHPPSFGTNFAPPLHILRH